MRAHHLAIAAFIIIVVYQYVPSACMPSATTTEYVHRTGRIRHRDNLGSDARRHCTVSICVCVCLLGRRAARIRACLPFCERLYDAVAHHVCPLLPQYLGKGPRRVRGLNLCSQRKTVPMPRLTSPDWRLVKYQNVGNLYLYTTCSERTRARAKKTEGVRWTGRRKWEAVSYAPCLAACTPAACSVTLSL
jgi:hypothetical protein